jgi:hypothetical protein
MKLLCRLLSCSIFLYFSVAAYAESRPEELIALSIKQQWEKPHHLVDIPVIAVGTHYALADWIQGKRGGRALMRLNEGKWQAIMCGNGQIKSRQALEKVGIPSLEAKKISEKLAAQEVNLTKEQLRLVDSFTGIVNLLESPEHHHESH